MNTQLGISALRLSKNFSDVTIYCYQVAFAEQPDPSKASQQLRGLATKLKYKNQLQAITDYSGYQLISMAPINTLTLEDASVTECGVKQFSASDSMQRSALQRLINQGIYSGAQAFSYLQGLSCDKAAQSATRLMEKKPSNRVKVKSLFLDVYKTLNLTPQLLSSGICLLQFEIKHSIVAKDHITLSWVLANKPTWLFGLKRVRNNYKNKDGQRLTFNFKGIDKTAKTTDIPNGMQSSLLDYHLNQGNLKAKDTEQAKHCAVIKVTTGSGNELSHLAHLLSPMFDFDTLSAIEPQLLNNIAKSLKWSVDERIRQGHDLCKGIIFTELGCTLEPLKDEDVQYAKLAKFWKLQFANGSSLQEKEVLRYKAIKPMTRQRLVPVIVGVDNDTAENREKMARAVASIKLISPESIQKTTNTVVIKDAFDLAARLAGKQVSDSIFLIALTKGADKIKLRDEAFAKSVATQFMLLDHPQKFYTNKYSGNYYNNVAAGLFSKGGGQLCEIQNLPGDVDLFVGLDMGGVNLRFPGVSFLFTASGAQLGWQIADSQLGEKLAKDSLTNLLYKCVRSYATAHDGQRPRHIVLHRDGKFYEDIEQIIAFEQEHNLKISVVEILKSGAPVLFNRTFDAQGKKQFANPQFGDYALLEKNEAILATYSGSELGSMGNSVSIRPLRIRIVHGDSKIEHILTQVIALSRIHGASLYRHPRLPVTTHHADRFATLRQEVDVDALSRMDRLCPVYL